MEDVMFKNLLGDVPHITSALSADNPAPRSLSLAEEVEKLAANNPFRMQ